MKLFKKLKDYNNLLEDILDKKTFSSVAKSLLLSMIYKLEISYKDYAEVNIDCISKEKFLDNILLVIKDYCDNVKIIEPDVTQDNLLAIHKVQSLTNTKERSILAYPTENSLFNAISSIEPKYFYLKDDYVFKNVFQKLLVKGYVQSNDLILKNFNGWSWDINVNEKQEYIPNIIYQNLVIIMGEDFMYKWRTDNKGEKNYLSELRSKLKSVTGTNDYYLSLCKILYMVASKNEKAKIKSILVEEEKSYRKSFSKTNEFRKEKIKEFNKLDNYHAILNNNKTQYEELVELQKYFLKYLNKKIQKSNLREEIIEIIYRLRYYENIMFFDGVLLKEYNPISRALDYTLKQAFTKACKMGIVKIISMDIKTNFEILKYIFDTRIITLEDIKIYLEIEDNYIFLKVYDKEVFEKQGKIKLKSKKEDIAVKQKRMIKLFNK